MKSQRDSSSRRGRSSGSSLVESKTATKPAMPTIEMMAALAANQEIALSPQRIAEATNWHVRMRPQLRLLRELSLSFLEPVIEPSTALRWIERGGRSK